MQLVPRASKMRWALLNSATGGSGWECSSRVFAGDSGPIQSTPRGRVWVFDVDWMKFLNRLVTGSFSPAVGSAEKLWKLLSAWLANDWPPWRKSSMEHWGQSGGNVPAGTTDSEGSRTRMHGIAAFGSQVFCAAVTFSPTVSPGNFFTAMVLSVWAAAASAASASR